MLSTLNAPTLNSVTFKLREREVGKAVESIAKSSCQNCLTMEKNEALQNGVKSDEGNLVPIPCSFDMGWQRRGKGHNSRTGQAAVMSLSSGKVLDYTSRTKSCRFCDWAKSTGKQPKAHDCRKNHVASSKAMEPDAAVELFNRAPTQGVKFSIYTGDDDSTTEAHIRQKVAYDVEKCSDIIHMKRSLTTRLYNLGQTAKFDNCSPLSQKVINHLVKCFSYAIAQNKGDSKGIQAALRCIVPHAFGDHSNCGVTWCGFKSDPASYKHKDLPYGKDLHGEKLQSALNNIFKDYCTDAVAEKLAPMTNSQRNEALNSVVGSKNPKIRFYGGSDSNDFRIACGIAQTNLRYSYVSRTLEALNIEPGNFCLKYGQKMTNQVNNDKIRKSSLDFKRGRANGHRQNCSQTARKEAREGKTYETGIGLNLDLNRTSTVTSSTLKEIESIVPEYTTKPPAKQFKYEENKVYNIIIFDTETTTTGKSAELCQLSATDQSGMHQFSTYVLPKEDIDYFASRVNKLKIFNINGERRLFKENKEVSTVPLQEAVLKFLSFISQSVDRTKSQTNKNIETVLLGHNSSIFDTPVLLRNSGTHFTERLQKMDICFADSLTLFKTLIRKKLPCLQNSDGTFPKPNQSSLYNFLFAKSFEAHDALEDVLALRKIIFESRLELSLKTIIENSGVVSAAHAANLAKYLDHRHLLMQSFKDNLHHPQYLKKNMVEKISGSGLSFDDLKMVYSKYGREGLIAILSKPPTSSSSASPRVSKTPRILATIVKYFEEKIRQ